MGQLTKDTPTIDIALQEVHDNLPKQNIVFDDFSFPVSNLKINPVTDKPDFDQNNIEYLFDPNSTETLIGVQITRHEFESGDVVWYPHVHWNQSTSGVVVWQLEYLVQCLAETEPAFTTITTSDTVVEYTGNVIHQISSFPSINLTNFDSTACAVKIKISRLGDDINDTYFEDARFLSFDFHVPIDQLGSRQIFIK